jgi:hypothetical protein
MQIEEIREGEKLFVKSLHYTKRRHGLNDSMREKLGKYIRIDSVNYDSVSAIGYTWNPHDLSRDEVKPVLDVHLTGNPVVFNPELFIKG